jgi:Ca-activated chloride channel family protein
MGAMHREYEMAPSVAPQDMYQQPQWNTEEYDAIQENIFHDALRNPLSTFSIDVDAASYSNMRRFINNGQRPPKDAVRIEEMVNYFKYEYPQPAGRIRFPSTPKFRMHLGIRIISW